MLILRTYKRFICLSLLAGTFMFLMYTGCCALAAGRVPEKGLDYSTSDNTPPAITPQQIEQEADDFFYKGVNAKNDKIKEAYLAKALAKYMLLLSIQPDNAIFCTQIAVIHDMCNRKRQAKQYFYRAVNLEYLNPFANFYFGEYYFNIKDYRNALKHYMIAFRNGYASYYELNNRLATVYEKLGDLQKAKDHYTVSIVANPNQKEINSKIYLLDKVYYSKKDYQHSTIRE